jgi:hypothetical protein
MYLLCSLLASSLYCKLVLLVFDLIYFLHLIKKRKSSQFLKRPLKELNQLHFSHISERVARDEAALENHQTVLHDDRDNLQLLEHDKQLRLTLMNLKSVEKMFFSQKLKCHFFKDSDRGSSFFHALMN